MSTFLFYLANHLKYLGIFLGAFIEGPATGLLAGFLSKAHYLNFVLAFSTHVLGDFLADSAYYFIGYSNGGKALPRMVRWLKLFKFSPDEAERAKQNFLSHPRKIIIVGKLTHVLGLPVLIGAGLVRYPWPKFLLFNFMATLVKSAVLIGIGYYLADRWQKAESIFSYIGLLGVALLVLLPFYLLGRYFKNKGKS